MAHDGPRPGAPGFRPGLPGATSGRPGAPTPFPPVRDMPTAPVPGGPPPVTRAVPSTAPSGAATGPRTDADIATLVDDELATLSDLPLAEHPQVYARLHSTLTDALAATVDQGR